jgi:hypothetical protein
MTTDHSDANKTVVFAEPPGTNNFVSASVPVGELNEDIMDVAFTKAVGCTQYPGGCDGMRKEHRFADAVPLGENWRHKYLIDIDGMGYSARLFALVRVMQFCSRMVLMIQLKSESAVLKSTVYTEFCSEWLQPWVSHHTLLHCRIQLMFSCTTFPSHSYILRFTTSTPTSPALPRP